MISQGTATQGVTQAPASPNTQIAVPDNTLDATLTCGLSNFQSEILKRVNDARANSRMCGGTLYAAAAPLTWNANLFNAAAGHARNMATANFFSHDGLDGSTFAQRISNAGYAWRSIGENIAEGQSTIEEVINLWLSSSGHCANIMSSVFSDIGVACVASTTATYSSYWTMDLGAPQ
jgi:uncharacterized protein YkwD